MVFSRPKFNRKAPGKFGGGDFEQGLDDLEDDGSLKKKDGRKPAEGGQKEFVNLGSSARPARDQEEEKTEKRVPGVKPTFKGKLNLTRTGAGADEKNEGVAKTYDFGVVFKTAHDGEKREFNKEGEGEHHGQRKQREKGHPFGERRERADEDDDFTLVKEKDRKPKKRNQDDSSDEEEGKQSFGARGGRGGFYRRGEGEAIRGGARVERGGNRGGRGDRGGLRRNEE